MARHKKGLCESIFQMVVKNSQAGSALGDKPGVSHRGPMSFGMFGCFLEGVARHRGHVQLSSKSEDFGVSGE